MFYITVLYLLFYIARLTYDWYTTDIRMIHNWYTRHTRLPYDCYTTYQLSMMHDYLSMSFYRKTAARGSFWFPVFHVDDSGNRKSGIFQESWCLCLQASSFAGNGELLFIQTIECNHIWLTKNWNGSFIGDLLFVFRSPCHKPIETFQVWHLYSYSVHRLPYYKDIYNM